MRNSFLSLSLQPPYVDLFSPERNVLNHAFKDTYLIDVREPDEVIQGMIPSAVNLPLTVLAESLTLAPGVFKTKHGYEKPKKDQRLIFYCRSGMRSASAGDVAKRNGFKKWVLSLLPLKTGFTELFELYL